MFLMLFKQVVLLLLFLNLVRANCVSQIIGEAVIEKVFGFDTILIPIKNSISLYDDERVDAYCETSFRKHPTHGQPEVLSNKIFIYCVNEQMVYANESDTEWSILYDDFLSCHRASDIELYDNKPKLDKCKDSSLVIGSSSVDSLIYAGICYDWNTKDLKYINYHAYKTKNMIAPPYTRYSLSTVSWEKQIITYKNSFRFMSQDEFQQGLAKLQEQFTLLSHFQFDYLNIMQDVPLEDISTKYDDILSIIWWRNLRQINWRNFLDLLEQRSKSIEYDVRIGTSGELLIPNPNNEWKSNTTFSIVTEDKLNKTAPAMIWARIQETSNYSSENFVVIGSNSPFVTSSKSLEFLCEDMCETIDWMRALGPTRHMPTMGLIICCDPLDVVNKLDNFPTSREEDPEETLTDIEIENMIRSAAPMERDLE